MSLCFTKGKHVIAAPPVDIDGIREPVSGSFLYGNNISAPRRSSFGPETGTYYDYIRTAIGLGQGVTFLAENSMPNKTPWDDNIRSLPGGELSYLWLKLNCLKEDFISSGPDLKDCQFPVVGKLNEYCSLPEDITLLMMCIVISHILAFYLMKDLIGSNGKPKDNSHISLNVFVFRRKMRTSGSFLVQPLRVCLHSRKVVSKNDGVSVVPAKQERETGKIIEEDVDATRMGDSNLPPEDDNHFNDLIHKIIKNWKTTLRLSKGVTVPKLFNKLVKLCQTNTKCKVHDIYPLLLDPVMYDLAYNQIKSNPGNMTKGGDNTTLDGWSAELRDKIIDSLKDESFQFSHARLIQVPKPKGGLRPIKIAVPRDKIVQRIMTYILEAIYEPAFSTNSFGFRPGLGCHDALNHIHKKLQATRWFIEGDISKCFDEIDHGLLIKILKERIADERFIRLICKTLKAGYLDVNKIPKNCLVGTPQGSIVSPILCNIFMSKFDEFIENNLMQKFTKGQKRQQPKEYVYHMSMGRYFSKKYKKSKNPKDLEACLDHRKKGQALPSVDPNDPNFRRLYYVRYADDWLIGFAGSHKETVEIKDLCKNFLSKIKLRLSEEKTVITQGLAGCIFLGTRIHVPLNQEKFKKNSLHKSRANLGVRLNAPLERVINKLHQAGYCDPNGIARPRMALYASSKDEIVGIYSSVLRGILNYYSFSDNYKNLGNSIFYILRKSLTKLLAAKFKLKSSRQVLLKFGKYLQREGKISFPDYKNPSLRGMQFKLSGGPSSRIAALFIRSSLSTRISNLECSVCGSTYKVEFHHIRELKDLNQKMDPINRAMAARRRKQIPLCRICHLKKHGAIRALRNSVAKANIKAHNKP